MLAGKKGTKCVATLAAAFCRVGYMAGLHYSCTYEYSICVRVCVWLGRGGEGRRGTVEHVYCWRTEEGPEEVVPTERGGYVHSATAIMDEKGIGWVGKPAIDD